jgi:adenylate cyclase
VLEAQGVAHGKTIPMLPMLELWRAFYGIAEGDSPEATRAKIAGRLLLMDEGYREALPFVFDLFGVPDPANPSRPIDPEQRQKRLHAVARRVLADPAYGGGTHVTLFEDLHWFDGASDAFLETMVESFPATRNLLLLNFRPEYQARWMGRSYYQQLPLQPLGPEAISALLRGLLGEHPSVTGLRGLVHARTRGNPFFIEEVVQSLVESGQLAGARGAYRLTTPLDALEVPASVQAVLAARIDRLPEREKQLLQTAAVIGATFSEELLRRVVANVGALGDAEQGAALSALVASEFLYEASLYPQLEYAFKHPLTQEVALRSQLRERRVRVHAAVAQALEAEGGGLDERAAGIAQHWDEADDASRAARWHARAAAWAGLSDAREGLRHWRRVRELAPRLADENERNALALQACQRILALGWRMAGSEAEAAAVYAEGRTLAEQSGDLRELALLLGRYSQVSVNVSGSARPGISYAEEAARLAESCDDPALRAVIATFPVFAYSVSGDGRAIVEWSERALAEAGTGDVLDREMLGYGARAAMLQMRAIGLTHLGRLEESEAQLREAERSAEESGELELLSWLGNAWAELADARGSGERVLERAQRSVEIAERLDIEASRVIAYSGLGIAHLLAGRAGAAREVLRESVVRARDRFTVWSMSTQTLARLAEAHLALGEHGDALATAREAIAVISDRGCDFFEANAQLALARVLLATDGGAQARAEIESALERAERLVAASGARVFAPRILELRGRLAAALGDAAASGRDLRRALDVYREIGATGHAERLAQELAS